LRFAYGARRTQPVDPPSAAELADRRASTRCSAISLNNLAADPAGLGGGGAGREPGSRSRAGSSRGHEGMGSPGPMHEFWTA